MHACCEIFFPGRHDQTCNRLIPVIELEDTKSRMPQVPCRETMNVTGTAYRSTGESSLTGAEMA